MRRPARSVRNRLLDILDASEKARQAVGERSLEALENDWLHLNATVRLIEIISEASRHVPDNLKATESHIPGAT